MKVLPPPGPARTRQLLLLGVVLIGAAFAVSRYVTRGPAITPPPTSNSPTRPAPSVDAKKPMPQPLELDKLEPVPEEPETTRNPFRFGTKPAPPAPPAPAYTPPPAQPPSLVPPVPRVDPIPLKFIGRVVLPDKKVIASLSDGKGNVLQGVEGQILDGRYRIVRIGEESLVIEHVNGTGRTTLPLKGS